MLAEQDERHLGAKVAGAKLHTMRCVDSVCLCKGDLGTWSGQTYGDSFS